MPAGRPTKVTPAVKREVLERLANGELLISICERENIPHRASIIRAMDRDEQFRDDYVRAREIGAEAMIEAGMRMVANDAHDTVETDDGRMITNHEVVARSRLHWDAIRWAASKFNAKRFGDKLDVAHAVSTITHTVDWSHAPEEKPADR